MAGVPEHWEQVMVVKALSRCNAVYCAVPNGGYRTQREAGMFKAEGVQKGMPDLLIFTPPPSGDFVGVALEMKKRNGKQSDLRESQRKWLSTLEDLGWKSIVGWGAMDAIEKLKDLGYEI
jgi:hypothetical protein